MESGTEPHEGLEGSRADLGTEGKGRLRRMVTTKVTTTSTEWLPWQSIHGQEPEEGIPEWIHDRFRIKYKSKDESGKSKEKENEE